MITKCTALQLAPKGIRVNSVNPGPVVSSLSRHMGITNPNIIKSMYDKTEQNLPLKLMAVGTDIAYSVLFLANNDKARNISGTILINDTGFMLDPGCMRPTQDEMSKLKQ